jgi:hypothetical protein
MPQESNRSDKVKAGLPPRRKSKGFNYVLLFVVVGVVLALAIVVLQDLIMGSGAVLEKSDAGLVLQQVIMNAVLSLLVGSVHAWIFKARIKSRIPLFVIFALFGGVVGGVVGGIMIASGAVQPLLVGAVNGSVAGAVSSATQNSVMNNRRFASRWLTFSIVSWMVVFAIGWAIGWQPKAASALALAAAFLMIASGASLTFFLRQNPQLEFG